MTLTVRQINRFFLLACAPFIGLALWLAAADFSFKLPDSAYPGAASLHVAIPKETTDKLLGSLDLAKQAALTTAKSLKQSIALYNATNRSIQVIVETAAAQANRPYVIYDRRITRKLGTPVGQIQSDRIRAQLFTIHAENFNAYALKVKLKSPEAMAMVLGDDTYGEAETTIAAARRYNAIAGINGGGFADGGGGRYPLSTTVMNGKYLGGFEPSYKDLFFVGLNEDMKLIGGNYTSQSELDKEKPRFGASFVPILMKNGVPQPIPDKWRTSPFRAPRTVIANYKDNQLLIIVADGRDENGSSGATLDEMQILLSRYGAIDGYNLDGGGSSTLVFDGRVVNHPSDGRPRPVATNFLFFK